MRAVIRGLHSPDIYDLKNYRPSTPDRFGFLLQILIGPENGPGDESFDVFVCTPRWILEEHSGEDVIVGRHMLIVFKYDYERLENFLRGKVAEVAGETWMDLGQRLARIGHWEFEDYAPARD